MGGLSVLLQTKKFEKAKSRNNFKPYLEKQQTPILKQTRLTSTMTKLFLLSLAMMLLVSNFVNGVPLNDRRFEYELDSEISKRGVTDYIIKLSCYFPCMNYNEMYKPPYD